MELSMQTCRINHFLQSILVALLIAVQGPAFAQTVKPTEWVTFTKERVAENCPTPCDRDAVVFVHGIFGARETWLNGKSGAYWPALIAADQELSNVDVYRADYENYLLKSGPTLKEVLESFTRGMREIHQRKYRSVQFVAHSLGGLVVRRYLLHVKLAYGHKSLSLYRQAIMLGTPSDGSYFASIGEIISRNQLLRVMRPIQENDFLQMLNASIDDLSKKHHQTFCPSLRFFVGYEKNVTFLDKIVSPESAANAIDCSIDGNVDGSCIKGFDRNHLTIVKPENNTDEVYTWTKKLIRDCADGISCKQFVLNPECGNLEAYTRGSADKW